MGADDVRNAIADARDLLGDAHVIADRARAIEIAFGRVVTSLQRHLETCGQPSGRDSAVTRRGNPRIAKDAVAMFLDRVDRGDEVAKSVLALVEENGLSINATSAGPVVRCTQLLERMYLQDADLLRRTLRTVVRAWDRQSVSLRGDVIEGVAMFYADAGPVDEDHLAAVLRTIAVPDLLRQTEGIGRRRKMAELFADLYTSHQTLF